MDVKEYQIMHYYNGIDVHAGDTVKLDDGTYGIVECVIETNEYTSTFPQEAWGYLKIGVMITTETMGLVHYPELDEDVEFVKRGVVNG